MDPRRASMADGIGRFLGLLGIIAAGGTAAFFYNENQQLQTKVNDIAATNTQQVEELNAAAAKFHETWNKQLSDAVKSLREDTVDARQAEKEAIADRERRFKDQLAKLDFDPADLRDIIREEQVKLALLPSAPLLRKVQRTMMTGENPPPNTLSIPLHNAGDQDAEIVAVTFDPKEEFKVDLTWSLGMNSSNRYVVRFDKDDNSATNAADEISIYNRKLLAPKLIPGNASFDVLIEIDDPTYLDWGWVGDLTIEYNDRVLEIPNVRAIYVDGDRNSA